MVKRHIVVIGIGSLIALGVGIGIGYGIWGEESIQNPPTEDPRLESPVVSVGTFGEVRGSAHSVMENVYTFLGVPYAKPPLGQLRFAPPVSMETVGDGVYNATHFSYQCVDAHGTPQKNDNTNEDCLYLNIHVPKTALTTNTKTGCNKKL